MQLLRQGKPETIPVLPHSDLFVSTNGGAWEPVVQADADERFDRYTIEPDQCGRLDLIVNGNLWHFMVICPNAYDSLMGADTLKTNTVSVAGRADAADALMSFAVAGYDREHSRVRAVERIEKVGEVEKPVKADLVSLFGNEDAAAHLTEAFDGIGYDFENCSMPTVNIVKSKVNANIESIKDADAKNLHAAFCGEGYAFIGSSIPEVGGVKEIGRAHV